MKEELREELLNLVNDCMISNTIKKSKFLTLYANDKIIGSLSFTSICLSSDGKYIYFYDNDNINFTMVYNDFKGNFKFYYYSHIAKQLFYKICF
jgi:hypothetical protein